MDRMLIVEIKSRCPHPSKRELEFVSLVSKLDRFHGDGDEKMPFYDILLAKVRKWCQFPLRSWLGERVISPNSPTIRELQALERQEGIERPDDVTCALDRQEENWLTIQEMGFVSRIFFEAAIDLDTKPHARNLVKVSRNLRGWREAGNALATFEEQVPIDRNLNMDKVILEIQEAYQKGYAAAEKAMSQEVHINRQTLIEAEERGELMPPDATAVLVKTLARSELTLNAANPYELVERSYKALMAIYHSRNWTLRDEKSREELNQASLKLFGYTLDALSQEHQRVSDL